MDENTMAKFEEKLASVIAMGKKKKNVLDFQEIVNQFAEFNLEEEQYDKIVETLEQKGIDVLRMTEEEEEPDEEALLAVEVESYLKKKSCKNRLQEAADAYF